MADFPSTNVRINSQLSPGTDTQTFPLFDTAHGLGGMRTVGTTADLNNIFDRRRTRGMMVYVSGVSAYYALIGTTANSGWTTEFQIGTGTNFLPLNNTFTGLNTFTGGISASSGLFETLQANSGATFNTNVYVGATLSVNGNLVVNGTTTTINSTIITVDDKNIELGSVASPTDDTANGGGISLKGGAGDYTIFWAKTSEGKTLAGAWNFNQDINLTKNNGASYNIDGNAVLTSNSLGSGITYSSLQTVGTILSGIWQGTRIGVQYGGTGLTLSAKGDLLVGGNSANTYTRLPVSTTNGEVLGTDGSDVAWRTIAIGNASGTSVTTLNSGVYRIQDATSSLKGLASFDSVNFTVSSGAVSINTIEGGTY